MRVLMLVSEAPPIKSGIARVAGELTERLRDMGVEVDVLSANEIPRATMKEIRFSSLALHWPRIQRQLGQYDILHIHGSVPTFSEAALVLGRLGSRLSRGASGVVYTHHCDIDLEGFEGIVGNYNRLHHTLLRLADHVVASTPSYALQLEATTRPGRVSAVPFGVNAEQFGGEREKPKRFNVLFVGQLRPYKGVDVLLRAWQQLEDADLHIVGTGHEAERHAATVEKLNLKSVQFHGAVTDAELARYYANAHVLVLPSTRRAEAFGLVLLEGMAAGCVPVASRLPGVSDVVGNAGITFPVGDSDALSRVLRRLCEDHEMRNRQAELARARALTFDWDHTANAYLGIYKQVKLGRSLEQAVKQRPLTAEVLQSWLAEVASEAGAERASIMLRPAGEGSLRLAASIAVDRDIVSSTSVAVGHRISGYVSHTRKPMLIRKKNMPAIARLYKQRPEITSSLVLPFHAAGRTLGVLNLARGTGVVSFNSTDRRWLHRLALQVSPLMAQYQSQPYGMMAPAVGHEATPVLYAPNPANVETAVPVPGVPGRGSDLEALPSTGATEDGNGQKSGDYAPADEGAITASARLARADWDKQDIIAMITEGWGDSSIQPAGGT